MLGYPNNKEKMSIETFGTIRDFNKKFPSKLYICTRCEQLTPNPYYCINCETNQIILCIGMEYTNIRLWRQVLRVKYLNP